MKMKMKVSKRNHSNTPSIAAWLLRSVMGIVVVACCCCSTVLLVAADDEATSSTTATYDPPIQFTQYEGGCDGEDSKTAGSGTVVSLTNLSWGRYVPYKPSIVLFTIHLLAMQSIHGLSLNCMINQSICVALRGTGSAPRN